MKTDSVEKRYVVTLFVNVFKLVLGVANSTIVPKSLGIVDFGNYQFLLRSFTSIRGFFNLGLSAAFLTYSSKNIKSSKAFVLFFGWNIVQLLVILIIAVGSFILKLDNLIFPDQTKIYIILIAVLEWLNYFSLNLIQFGETKAESVYVQKINFCSNIAKLFTTVFLFYRHILDLDSFIMINYLGSLLIVLFIAIYFSKKDRKEKYFEEFKFNELKETLRYFVTYCSPLVIYELFGFFSNYFDRWLLQITSGSVQQAYFSLSYQWATISMIFTTSVVNIFWREISYSIGVSDFVRVENIYKKSFRTLFFSQV